jgi:hypothetical protein
MTKPKLLVRLALLLLIAAELWMFSGSFNKYFNLDSAFYVIHAPHSWDALRHVFLAPDAGKQYRPLTLAFMALLVPIFRLDPRPYHWIPLLFHLANTLLVYGLARRVLKGTVAVLAATAFWGLHSVAGWVTYDTTCLSDFMLAFLLLVSFTLAVDGSLKQSRLRNGGSVLFFILALLTKEAAVTAPLALAICIVLANLHSGENTPAVRDIWRGFKKALPLTSIFLGITVAYSTFLTHWLRAGLIYTQGNGAAYNINPWANLFAKAKYFFWALNLPDYLYIPDGTRVRLLAFGLMGLLLLCLLAEILRRRGRMEPAGWAGLVWLVGMNLPALMLSDRIAKWYLYVPLLGLSLTLGTLAQSLRDRLSRWKAPVAVPAVLTLFIIPTFFSSVAQNRSYLSFSDASYASDVLQSFYRDLQSAYPERPPQATVFMLPSFEPTIMSVLASPPVNGGGLLELHYTGTKARMLFAHMGERLSHEQLHDPNVRVIQNLYDRFYDVTNYYRHGGKMTLYVLPTSEGTAPPLLKREPAGGRSLYDSHVELLIADEGACLPDDYRSRADIWILQYIDGRFYDVTRYFKGNGKGRLIILPTLDAKIPPLPVLEKDALLLNTSVDNPLQILTPNAADSVPREDLKRPGITILQYLDGRYFDVTQHYKSTGRMTVYLLPTSEGVVPDPLKRASYPALTRWREPRQRLFGDEGILLPEDYYRRTDLWIVQYINGHFYDVTDYYRGRRRDPSRRVITRIEDLQASVSRNEYYPSYSKFATPTGAPVFFPTPQKEIVTQIGGSTVTVPMGTIPSGASLHFDVSWMYDSGDGGWAEMRLRSNGRETILFQQYMHPNPKGAGLKWREVEVDLLRFEGLQADLVLRCYNDRGRNTVADWLNWRDIVMEEKSAIQTMAQPRAADVKGLTLLHR